MLSRRHGKREETGAAGAEHAPLVLEDLGDGDALGDIHLQDAPQQLPAAVADLHARRDSVVAPDHALQLLRRDSRKSITIAAAPTRSPLTARRRAHTQYVTGRQQRCTYGRRLGADTAQRDDQRMVALVCC